MFELFGIPPQALFGQLLLGLINGSFYAMLSLGLAVIFGLLNIINFAHGAQYMMGAFVAWMLLHYLGIGYWWALLLAPLIVGAFGIVIERLMLSRLYKLDHLYGLLLTFGLALIIQGLFRNQYGVSGPALPHPPQLAGGSNLGFMFLPNYRAWVVVASLVVCLGTWFVIEKTRLGAYLRAATENPTLVGAFGINVPRLITLTYGFGVALAAFAGVLAAPIYSVNPNMGADLIIVVFAVVVIGGMGSILGAIVTGFGLGIVEGLTKVFYPEGSADGDLRHHGDRAAGEARRACSGGPRDDRRRPTPRRRHAGADRRRSACRGITWRSSPALLVAAAGRAVLPLSGLPDEGAVLRAVRLRLQPAARLWRPAVLRPCRLFRLGELCLARYAAKVWGLRRSSPSSRHASAAALLGLVFGALAIRRQGIYFAMVTLAFAQMVFFFSLQAPFTGGEDGIQAVPRGRLFGLFDLADDRTLYFFVAGDRLRAGLLLIYRIIHSPFGQVLKAIRENEPRAISLGYRVNRYKLAVFVLSADAGRARRRDQGHRLPARLADRRPLDDVGRGGADDAARRHGHGVRPDRRRGA